jgi:DNA polymerase-3 subunit chi
MSAQVPMRVDFYVLKSVTPQPRLLFACRLAEKAYLLDMRVVILTETQTQAATLDELLWTFNQRSFVPHAVCHDSAAVDVSAPVQLTTDPAGGPAGGLLVNLSNRLPADPQRFTRIAEIVDADAETRRLGRDRFKAYRDLQLTLETHQLDPTADA